MTSKEKLLAALGGAADAKPTFAWPESNQNADVQVCSADEVSQGPSDESAVLAFVPNLYRRFQLMGKDPVAILKDTTAIGMVEEAEAKSLRDARGAIEGGAMGVFYEIHGADASQCTPMEYGGLFLEKDRAFLEAIADAPCNVIYINGKQPYLDFVSDLPAKVFAWDIKGSGIPVSEVRKMRDGLLAADASDADLELKASDNFTDILQGVLVHA